MFVGQDAGVEADHGEGDLEGGGRRDTGLAVSLALQERAAFGLGDRRADDRHLGPGEGDGGEAEHEGERCDASHGLFLPESSLSTTALEDYGIRWMVGGLSRPFERLEPERWRCGG